MTHPVTINLSDRLYSQLKRTSELTRQPVETIVEQSLAHSLPPLLEDIPAEYQADVYPLLQMDEAALQREVRQLFPAEHWSEYETLLEKNQNEVLTAKEQVRLDTLKREADVLMFRKGYAAVLLKRRGYRVPTVSELPLPR